MRNCSVTKKLQIVPGSGDDYKGLAHYHYRDPRRFACPSASCEANRVASQTKLRGLGPYSAIFALRANGALGLRLGEKAVGVIVYTMPSPGLELRNVATGNLFVGFDRSTRLALINKNIRCISRVIIEPRFRGLGLASRLVRETMPEMGVPIVEAMAVMGLVNPFFEKAGMRAFTAKIPARCVQLVEAFSTVGIEKEELINPQKVEGKLDRLGRDEAEFVELQIRCFLQSYGKRRYETGGLERTKFILSKLTYRPVYYIWFNPELELITS